MSALAMILVAAMGLPGDGSEKVSGEMEQGLDLRGTWEGTYSTDGMQIWSARLSGETLRFIA
jgi:hypothetical protein